MPTVVLQDAVGQDEVRPLCINAVRCGIQHLDAGDHNGCVAHPNAPAATVLNQAVADGQGCPIEVDAGISLLDACIVHDEIGQFCYRRIAAGAEVESLPVARTRETLGCAGEGDGRFVRADCHQSARAAFSHPQTCVRIELQLCTRLDGQRDSLPIAALDPDLPSHNPVGHRQGRPGGVLSYHLTRNLQVVGDTEIAQRVLCAQYADCVGANPQILAGANGNVVPAQYRGAGALLEIEAIENGVVGDRRIACILEIETVSLVVL